MKLYRYTSENRLEQRCDYKYTPYEGPDFLGAYLRQREEWCQRLEEMGRFQESVPLAEEVAALLRSEAQPVTGSARFRVLPQMPGSATFATRDVLLDLWQRYRFSIPPHGQPASAWLECLVRKFEVSKRLYTTYDTRLKPVGTYFHDLETYALFAALCLFYHRRTSNLKYLNAALKVCDLLGSVPAAEYDPCTAQLCRAVAEAELDACRTLMEQHAVVT